jgi:hypothetical protein
MLPMCFHLHASPPPPTRLLLDPPSIIPGCLTRPSHGSQAFYLPEAVDVDAGDRIEGTVTMTRQAENPRLYDVELGFYVLKGSTPATFITHKYQVP